MQSKTIRLKVIPAPISGSRTVLLRETPGLFFETTTDVGPERWICGTCKKVLAKGLHPFQVQSIVMKCACGAFNESPVYGH